MQEPTQNSKFDLKLDIREQNIPIRSPQTPQNVFITPLQKYNFDTDLNTQNFTPVQPFCPSGIENQPPIITVFTNSKKTEKKYQNFSMRNSERIPRNDQEEPLRECRLSLRSLKCEDTPQFLKSEIEAEEANFLPDFSRKSIAGYSNVIRDVDEEKNQILAVKEENKNFGNLEVKQELETKLKLISDKENSIQRCLREFEMKMKARNQIFDECLERDNKGYLSVRGCRVGIRELGIEENRRKSQQYCQKFMSLLKPRKQKIEEKDEELSKKMAFLTEGRKFEPRLKKKLNFLDGWKKRNEPFEDREDEEEDERNGRDAPMPIIPPKKLDLKFKNSTELDSIFFNEESNNQIAFETLQQTDELSKASSGPVEFGHETFRQKIQIPKKSPKTLKIISRGSPLPQNTLELPEDFITTPKKNSQEIKKLSSKKQSKNTKKLKKKQELAFLPLSQAFFDSIEKILEKDPKHKSQLNQGTLSLSQFKLPRLAEYFKELNQHNLCKKNFEIFLI